MYDRESVNDDRLTIPHQRMLEREFVLRPLCEYALVLELCAGRG